MTDPTCTCPAYRFPHRAGGGACRRDEPGPYCTACGEPTRAERIDYGAAYLVAHDVRWESVCCGSRVEN